MKLQLKDIQHYPLDGSTKILIKHHSEEGWGKGTLTPNTLNDFNMKGYLIKPLLTSNLSEEDYKVMGVILGLDSNEALKSTVYSYIKGFMDTSLETHQKAMDYLYSQHWYFNLDKSLYIEKT